MPSPRERHRNNIRMGVLVSASLLLALIVVTSLTNAVGRFLVPRDHYIVEFSLRSGVMHLDRGSAVRVGGMRMGEVIDVKPRHATPLEKIDVVFALDRKVHLYRDAQILVISPLIAQEAWIDISNVGSPAKGRPGADEPLEGSERPGMLAMLLGPDSAERMEEMVVTFHEILENVHEFSQVFTRAPEDYDAIVSNIREITENVRQLSARIRLEDWPQWAESVGRVMSWAADATESLQRLIDQGNNLLASAREIVGENREDIRQFVVNAEALSEQLREFAEWASEDGRDRLIALLDSGVDAVEHVRHVLERFNREHFDRLTTDLGFVMANASHASQQLKLAMTEIRRAPWKALHIPSAEEVAHEYLYDAMRQFAIAGADLKAASVAAQRILDNHGEVVARDDKFLEQIKNDLLQELDRYHKARQRLMDVLAQE